MSSWAQMMMQEGHSPLMQHLSLFHDYSLMWVAIILLYVMGGSLSTLTNSMLSESSIVTMIEVIWTILPIMVLIWLAVPSLHLLYFMEDMDPFLTLKVMGHQWYWEYNMADMEVHFDAFLLSFDTLYNNPDIYRMMDTDCPIILPVKKNIRALITSSDVLHSWAIPSLGVKADAVPGRLNQVYLKILRPSQLYGQCSEICGANHSFMPINIEAVSVKKFLMWCNEMCVGINVAVNHKKDILSPTWFDSLLKY